MSNPKSSSPLPPSPTPAQVDALRRRRAELARAASESTDATSDADDRRSRDEKRGERRSPRLSTGIIVFFGSLLGTLIGVAADFGDAADTLERLRSSFYPQLCVVGSDTILSSTLGLSQDWETAFEQLVNTDPNADVVRVTFDAVGSVSGVERAAAGGCAHVLASSEPIQPFSISQLSDAGLEIDCAAEIGYDVISFVTDINNPVPVLDRRALSGVLRGAVDNWTDVNSQYDQPISIYYRPGSGTTDFVFRNLINREDPNSPPPGALYLTCTSNETCLDATLATPGSLYWVSVAWMQTQPPEYLRVLPILSGDEAAVNPLTQAVDLDEYPGALIRPLYLYTLRSGAIPADVQALARRFVEYTRSVRGQQVLESHAFYTYFSRPAEVDVPLPPGFEPDANGIRPLCRPTV